MGVNAQTTVPTFVTSQVLTADQMNQSARTGVPVFAGTSERDAAFGGTGEKVLAEGQLCYLESTNVVQYYDGSVWATVGPQTFSSGLTYITGATFTAVSEILVDNCFTSTYRNYKILLDSVGSSASAVQLRIQYRTGGSNNATLTQGYLMNLVTEASAVSGTYGGITNDHVLTGYVMSNASSIDITVFTPQIAIETRSLAISAAFGSTNSYLTTIGGIADNATQFDGIRIFPVSGTFTGQYRIYGLANS